MPNDLVELARICVKHSRASPHPKIAAANNWDTSSLVMLSCG